MKLFTLVVTDGSYIDVITISGSGKIPNLDELLSKIDFEKSEALLDTLAGLIAKIELIANDYAATTFEKYLFHLKYHGEFA